VTPRRDTLRVSAARAIPRVLSIAGSDSGGGAGIQADLRAFARCGVYGMSALTAVTAQNTRGVVAVHAVPAAIVRAQIEAVVGDIGVDGLKIGMLVSGETAKVVASCLRDLLPAHTPVVVDPVLAASTGGSLLSEDGIAVLIAEVFPRATVITPNLPEARTLVARATHSAYEGSDDGDLARQLLALGPASVVITGGHRRGFGDLYCDAEQLVELGGERHESAATHGSGCTHSAVLAAELARGALPLDAARTAARYAAEAIRDGLASIGAGDGPVDVLGVGRPDGTF